MKKLFLMLLATGSLAFKAEAMAPAAAAVDPAGQFQQELNAIRAEVLAGTYGAAGRMTSRRTVTEAIKATSRSQADQTARQQAAIAFFNGPFGAEIVNAVNAIAANKAHTKEDYNKLSALAFLIQEAADIDVALGLNKLTNRTALKAAQRVAEQADE